MIFIGDTVIAYVNRLLHETKLENLRPSLLVEALVLLFLLTAIINYEMLAPRVHTCRRCMEEIVTGQLWHTICFKSWTTLARVPDAR